MYSWELTVDKGETPSLYFDRRFFVNDEENGRIVKDRNTGTPLVEGNLDVWSADNCVEFLTNSPFVFEFTVETANAGTLTYSWTLDFNYPVSNVSLDKDQMLF